MDFYSLDDFIITPGLGFDFYPVAIGLEKKSYGIMQKEERKKGNLLEFYRSSKAYEVETEAEAIAQIKALKEELRREG